MKALIVLILFVTCLAFTASEGYRFKGPNEIFKARPARWQSQVNARGWIGGNTNAIRPGVAENDPDYYPKLFNWLDKVGRR